jgi:hypothetical protein
MTTFTLQDLTPVQQEAVKQHEAMHAAYQVLNTRSINNLPTTPEEDEAMKELFEKMGQDLTAQHAPVPQPSEMGEPLPKPSQVSPEALIEHMVAQFSTNLRLLLTTIISQPKAQPEGGENSLQECVDTTLQQADWFNDMVKEQVQECAENAVENYFHHGFDPTDYFDFGDAVSSEVSDQLDDVVRDRLDEVVQEQLEEVVAEKLKSIRVVFD